MTDLHAVCEVLLPELSFRELGDHLLADYDAERAQSLFDIRRQEPAVVQVLYVPELSANAATVLGQLGTATSQRTADKAKARDIEAKVNIQRATQDRFTCTKGDALVSPD